MLSSKLTVTQCTLSQRGRGTDREGQTRYRSSLVLKQVPSPNPKMPLPVQAVQPPLGRTAHRTPEPNPRPGHPNPQEAGQKRPCRRLLRALAGAPQPAGSRSRHCLSKVETSSQEPSLRFPQPIRRTTICRALACALCSALPNNPTIGS